MDDRINGIAWNDNHNVDLQMLLDIAAEAESWKDTNIVGYDIAQLIRTVVARAQKGQWS